MEEDLHVVITKLICHLHRLINVIEELYEVWMYDRSKRWINRKWFIRPYYRKRLTHGFFFTNFQDVKSDEQLFFAYTRMDLETFKYLLGLVKQQIIILRQSCAVVSAEERLVMTLRYLATGDEITSISLSHRISETTVRKVIKETCFAIYEALSPVYIQPPNTVAWRNIAKGFLEFWNLPNCIGAIDGKHVKISAPSKSGSYYFNYKHFHSIVLLAACNHRYEFTCVDIGAFGSESDSGVFTRSNFGKALNNGMLHIPEETPCLPNSTIETPYFFVGDEAFSITRNIMRPYSGRNLEDDKRIFNYRLSRARQCIENAFGILTNRWRIFNKSINLNIESVKVIVTATVCLHNFLMSKSQRTLRQKYCPDSLIDDLNEIEDTFHEQLRNNCEDNNISQNLNCNKITQEAYKIRENLKNYFLTPAGEVPWQRDYIDRGRYQDAL